MAKLSPVFNDQTIDENGDPYVGAKLFTYVAGSSTKQTVYTNAAGTVPHSNPIILDSLGFPTQGAIWIQEGISIKFVLAPPTDTDPPTSPIKTIDNVQGVNDASVSISEWQPSGVTPTYISANSFSVQGDQTTEFQKGRRAQLTTGLGTVHGKIINSVFAASITTVTMQMDGSSVLDSGLSVVNLSLLRYSPTALPNPIELTRSTVVANATTTPLWDAAYGDVQDWTDVVAVTALPAAPQAGATRRVYPAAGASIANALNISVQGNATATAEAGDEWIITAITTTTFYVRVVKKAGNAVVVPVRQTVLSGPVDTNGAAAFGGATGATTVTASGTLVLTSANGFSATLGAINRIGSITNPAWTGLNGVSATYYAYLDIAADGTCTTGSTTLAPTYRQGGADVITNNQFTFNIQEMVGKVGNGTIATQVHRVFVGEFATSAGSVVTSITWYALRRRAVMPLTALSAAAITYAHNLGVMPANKSLVLRCLTGQGDYSAGDEISIDQLFDTTTPFFKQYSWGVNYKSLYIGVPLNGVARLAFIARNTNVLQTLTPANWNFVSYVDGGW